MVVASEGGMSLHQDVKVTGKRHRVDFMEGIELQALHQQCFKRLRPQ